MKRLSFFILFYSLVPYFLFSQTGTIKIVKPLPPKKDTVVTPRKKAINFTTSISSNYTFKGNNKFGYDAEASFLFHNVLFIGLKYSNENQYYQLSPFNKETLKQEIAYSKSENKSDYLKIPIGFKYQILTGSQGRFLISIGLSPEYLLKTKNHYGRLNYSDFNQFNLAGTISLGIPIFRKNYSINVSYSKDFFENLKDKNMYDQNGAVLGKQKSKTNLLSLSLSYHIRYFRN
ncbi:MAG: hypothetical protein A3F72_14380 [Bacteroidetes bacterium RIFCSPLOWO2_12_FULL_35_15]|nr:MAG: hypothetical protein A3F72_14380 [Bacteroidetes bacterium RIFCSPLOWO2_12_FULL_35_15]